MSAEVIAAAPQARGRLAPAERRRVVAMFTVVLALHLVGFALMILAVRGHYRISTTSTFGLGTGLLAYSLGLRHAFDADHISAIDNTTRALMARGKRPLGVGFFFSLGHSTIVFVMAVLLNFGIRRLYGQVSSGNSALHRYSGLIGTSVSGGFLLLIATLNLVVLVSIVRMFREIRAGQYDEARFDAELDRRGLLMRFFGPLVRGIDSSWKMYPLGMLFGLGFDTATEISLLVLAGTSVAAGLPFWAILSLPILFAAGMSLLDTVDGTFMNFAYGWAFSKPVRKVFYNLAITGLSVAVALFIGGLEVTQVIASELDLRGGFWSFASGFDLNKAGVVIVGLFVAVWVLALAIWRFGRVEARWDAAVLRARTDEA